MSHALARFAELKRRYRELVPARRVPRSTWRAIAHAAAIEQIRETLALEAALGRLHDRAMLEQLRADVVQILTAAGAVFNQQKG
jgi:hypothetical protein